MPQLTISGVVREILSADLNLSADEVIRRAKAQGLKSPESSIRTAVHNIKSELKGQAAKAAPSVARETSPSEPTPEVTIATTAGETTPVVVAASTAPAPSVSAAPTDLATVFANVAVNRVIGLCGGVESTRQAAESVRACGGVDAFLMHLDLVASVRVGGPPV